MKQWKLNGDVSKYLLKVFTIRHVGNMLHAHAAQASRALRTFSKYQRELTNVFRWNKTFTHHTR